jgi:hypothetical protein
MTGNTNFPDVGTYLTDLVTAFDEYLSAIPSPQSRNQINVAKRIVKEKS